MTASTVARDLREVIFAELRRAWYQGWRQTAQAPGPDTVTEAAFAASSAAILAAIAEAQPTVAATSDEQAAVIDEQFAAAWKTGQNVKLGWATPEGFFDAATDAIFAIAVTRKAV